MSDSLKRSGRPRAQRVDTSAPAQVRFPGRALLRTIIVLVVGQLVAHAASWGLDWQTFAPDMVESLTNATGVAFAGIAQCITIIGIPVGLANFKIATIALWPVGRRVVPVEVAQAAREANARRRFQ